MKKEPIKYKPLIIASAPLLIPAIDLLVENISRTIFDATGETGMSLGREGGFFQTASYAGCLMFMMYYWTSGLEKVRPPRLKNFARLQFNATRGLLINKDKDPELWLDTNLRIHDLSYTEPHERYLQQADYFVRTEDLETAIEHYQRYLGHYEPIKENPIWALVRAVAQPLEYLTFPSNSLADLIERANGKFLTGDKRAARRIWKTILAKYSNEDVEIIHAMFSTATREPDAEKAWKKIIERHEPEFKSVGDSRNKVFEIPPKKTLLIVKKGEGLVREFDILKRIYNLLPPEERISVVPLAAYGPDNDSTLITLRRNSPNLDSILGSKTEEERKKLAAQGLKRLQTLHSLDIHLFREYDPLKELQRRLIKRFKEKASTGPQRLLSAYEEFRAKFQLRQKPIHGDAYPSNVLEDGTILDLEKANKGDPWADYETFTTHPVLLPFQNELLSGIDQTNRSFFTVHIPLCQTGSFYGKPIRDPEIVKFFYNTAIKNLRALGEKELLQATEAYLEPTISSL